MSELVRKNYPELGEVKAPYVHSVRHNNTLYFSGLTAFGTPAQQAGIAEQAEEIFSQIRKVASAEGTDLSSLIKVTIFITSFNEINELRKVLYRNYGDHLPASSLVEVSRLKMCTRIRSLRIILKKSLVSSQRIRSYRRFTECGKRRPGTRPICCETI